MKALHLISSSGIYGAERMLLGLVRAQASLECVPVVAVFENSIRPNVEIAHLLRRAGIEVGIIPCRGRLDWHAIRAIRRLAAGHKIDIVHTHGYKADIYGFLATRFRGTPIVATCHNWTRADASLKFYAKVDRYLLRYFQKLVSVSEELTLSLAKARIRRGNIVTIANGVSVSEFDQAVPVLRAELGNPASIVGTVARMVPEKGIPEILDAARAVLQAFPSTIFVFAGDGPQRMEFEARARELGIAASVRFLGHREDMRDVYQSFDIFLLPSHFEGMPMSVLEAMAAGVPVVTTPVGGLKDLVRDGRTGLSVPIGDAASLSRAIQRLLADVDFRRRLGRAGKKEIEASYSVEHMAHQYLNVYKEALCRSV